MIPIAATLQLAFTTSWTLASDDARVTLTARELCISGDCAAPGSPKVDPDGTWVFDSGVRVRWLTYKKAELSLRVGGPWVKGTLSFRTPSAPPPPGIEVLSSLYPGPSPGTWYKATVDCDRAKPVWVYTPIIGGQPELAFYPKKSGWSVRSGVTVSMCHDAGGQYGGV